MQNIDINLKPSKVFVTLGFVLLISCAFIIYSLPMLRMGKTVLWLLSGRYAWVILKQYGLLIDGRSIYRLSFDAAGWKLYDRLGVSLGHLCGESTLMQGICVLRFAMQANGDKRTCLVFRDSVSLAVYKQLLMLLRTVSLERAEKPI